MAGSWTALALITVTHVTVAVEHDGKARIERDDDVQTTDDEAVAEWISGGGYVLLIVGLLAIFWALAVVVEDYFVPALNIMCEKFSIPDDVAGATFMVRPHAH